MANPALRLMGSGVGFRAAPPARGFSLRSVWRALMRRKPLLLAPVALITLGAFFWAVQQPPMYTAEALLHAQEHQARVVQGAGGAVEGPFADTASIEGEVELMRSPAFIRRTVQRLGLGQDPEFAPWLVQKQPGLFGRLLERVGGAGPALPGGEAEDQGAEPRTDPTTAEVNAVTQNVADRLTVERAGRSNLVVLRFLSEGPTKAARIANAMADEYLASVAEARYATADRAIRWLSGRIDELRGRVLESEAKIAERRAAADPAGAREPLLPLELVQVAARIALAQAEHAAAEARLGRAQNLLDSDRIETAAAVLGTPLLDDLRGRQAELASELAKTAAVDGTDGLRVASKRAEIEGLHDRIRNELRRIVQDLRDEATTAIAHERDLQDGMVRLRDEAARLGLSDAGTGALDTELASNRELVETFLAQFRELVAPQGSQDTGARIISAADPPSRPSHPRIMLPTLAAFAASLALGGLLVLGVERWDANYGFRSADDTQAMLGTRALALVPDLRRRDTRGLAAEDYVLQKPNSAYAEALQRIRTSLFLGDGEDPPKTLLITSSVPLEGKSTIAASLARQSAHTGLRVMLIDADLRQPRLHEVIGLANQNGLSEVLSGRADPAVAIKRDDKSGLDFLPAGQGAASPPDLFRSSTMRILLEETAAYYDLVVIDSPPVAAVSDSLILCGLVDRSIYVIRWRETPRNLVLAGLRQMLDAGADLAGVVLSRVDLRKHARYEYADSGSYRGSYRKYYSN